jgi:CRISPR system Cascade subunit CasB
LLHLIYFPGKKVRSMTDPTTTVVQTVRRELEAFVGRRVSWIQAVYLDPARRSDGAGWLAQLRQADDRPGNTPATWMIEFDGFPERLLGKTDDASAAERAAHLAFMLYSVHQQSRTDKMHQPGYEHGLGRAVYRLSRLSATADDQEARGKLPTRFAALGTASDFTEIAHYARQLIVQLRSEAIPLDYGRLAGQLHDLQNPATADRVRLAWGRDFARGRLSGSSASTSSSAPDQKAD